jgi:cytochrome P450
MDWLSRMAREYGDIAHVRVGTRHVYVLSHPDYVKEMLVTNSAALAKGKLMSGARRVLGEGLLTSGGERHQRQRRATAPAFHRDSIERYTAAMVECAARYASGWRNGETLDVHQEMMRLTLAIAGRTLFSTALEDDAELRQALNTFVRMSPLALLPFFDLLGKLPVAPMRRIEAALQQLDRVVYRLIREHRERPRADMLSLLLDTYRDANISERELRDECVAMIFAGYETTSNALTWTWYLLSQNPDAEEKLYRELDSVLRERLPTAADIPVLRYTEMVLAESVRMYPPGWAIGRRALAPARIAGYAIPKGSLVITSQWVIHRDPRWYPNPNRFDPERWTEAARQSRPAFSYFPFGAGPRRCIGEDFAWTEAILVIATIAQQWRLRLVPGHPVETQPVVTLRPRHGMRMTVERRAL